LEMRVESTTTPSRPRWIVDSSAIMINQGFRNADILVRGSVIWKTGVRIRHWPPFERGCGQECPSSAESGFEVIVVFVELGIFLVLDQFIQFGPGLHFVK